MTTLPCGADHLKAAVAELERMRATAISENCPMLALTLQLARDEAADELARRTAKRTPCMRKKSVRRAGSNIIRFPRRRLAKRRNARMLAGHGGAVTAELLSFADRAARLRA